MSKAILVSVLLLAAGAGTYAIYRKQHGLPILPAGLGDKLGLPAAGSDAKDAAADHSASAHSEAPAEPSPEQKVFLQLAATLENDPVFKAHIFPPSFYDAVKMDYGLRKEGKVAAYNPDVSGAYDIKYGLPGSFMGVSDAWMASMQFSDETHGKLWTQYAAWQTEVNRAATVSALT